MARWVHPTILHLLTSLRNLTMESRALSRNARLGMKIRPDSIFLTWRGLTSTPKITAVGEKAGRRERRDGTPLAPGPCAVLFLDE